MKKSIIAALLVGVGAPAGAATVAMTGVGVDDDGHSRFAYRARAAAGDSFHRGSAFVIYDFAGYIDGSIFTVGGNLAGSVEMVGALPRPDGLADDPALVNLVFTFVGTPTRNLDGTFDPGGFGASTLSGRSRLGAFHANTVSYDIVGARTARVDWQGALLVPMPIPEPGVWATMIAGLGLAGAAIRRRRRPLAA